MYWRHVHALPEDCGEVRLVTETQLHADLLQAQAPTMANVYPVPLVESARRFQAELSRWPLISEVSRARSELDVFRSAASSVQPDADQCASVHRSDTSTLITGCLPGKTERGGLRLGCRLRSSGTSWRVSISRRISPAKRRARARSSGMVMGLSLRRDQTSTTRSGLNCGFSLEPSVSK